MSASVPSMSYAAELGMGATSTITQGFELKNETLTSQHTHEQTDGIRGSRSRQSETVVEGNITNAGSVEFTLTPTTSAFIWPFILGAAGPSPFKLANVLPYLWVQIDRVAKVFLYDHLKVNKATIKSEAGKPLTCVLDLVGFAETVTNAGTFTGGLMVPIEQPFMHYQGVFTFNSATRNVKNHTLVIDNKLITDQFRNSQTLQVIGEGDRVITLEAETPWTADEVDLISLAVAAGVGGSIAYTNGAHVLTFTFGALQFPERSPNVPGLGQEIPLKVNFNARKLGTTAGTTDEIVVTQT